MTIRNISKTDLKHSTPSEMKTMFKTSQKTLCKRLCWTFHYDLKKYIYFNNNKMLIKCSPNIIFFTFQKH